MVSRRWWKAARRLATRASAWALACGREVALGVELADGFAEGEVDDGDGALVAGTLLRSSAEGGAEEGEALVGEGLGEVGGAGFEEMEDEVVLPGGEGGGGDQGGFALEGGGLPDVEGFLGSEAGGAEVLGPVEAGGLGGEVGGEPEVVGVLDVFVVGERDVLGGDGVLEGEDAGGAGFGIGEAGEAEEVGDVGGVLGADLLHVRGVVEVVVAGGKDEATLHEVGGVVVGVVEAGSYPEAEEVGRVVVGHVEGIDVGAEGEAERAGEVTLVFDGGDAGEVGLEGGEAALLDGGLVHVGVVEVGDAAKVGVGSGIGLRGLGDDGGDLLVGAVGELGEGADS